MTDEILNQPATKGDLQVVKKELQQEIQSLRNDLPRIVTDAIKPLITDEFSKIYNENQTWKDEILTSNDKVAKEYKMFETEKAAINENYKDLDQRVQNIERFAREAAPKVGIVFERT